ncbi:hypothetical protein NP233_g5905 [Leucocoprinus birnbaumii]|uniref:Uncharacterized protein n=1 Tax=Leucocoprinus birnbaumii TaxID=56174 RepID=A0AAD5VS07_9AGAR|nr:hypothetical protein NP233_g5905 [Leucocoprinus birnbaumii]
MLRYPVSNVTQIPLLELEKIMVRAERLKETWTGSSDVVVAPRHTYQSDIPSDLLNNRPVAVMGEYIVFKNPVSEWGPTVFSFVWMLNNWGQRPIAFQYRIAKIHNQYRSVSSAFHMNCSSQTFYIVDTLYNAQAPSDRIVKFVGIGIGPGGPRITTERQIPGPHSGQFMLRISDFFVYTFQSATGRGDLNPGDVEIHVWEIRTGEAFKLFLQAPHWATVDGIPHGKNKLYLSENLLVLKHGLRFTVYSPWKVPGSPTEPMKPQPVFHGLLPPGTLESYSIFPSPISSTSFTLLCFPGGVGAEIENTHIQLWSIEDSGSGWSMKELKHLRFPSRELYMRSSCLKSCPGAHYALGIFSKEGHRDRNRKQFYTVHLDLSPTQDTTTRSFLNLREITIPPFSGNGSHWVSAAHFDPFSGKFLFHSGNMLANSNVLAGPKTITILDFLGF